PSVSTSQPRGKSIINAAPQGFYLTLGACVGWIFMDCRNQLRPSSGKKKPFTISGVFSGKSFTGAGDQLCHAPLPIPGCVYFNSDPGPCSHQLSCPLVRHRLENAFEEQGVEIDPDIMMIERQVRRPRVSEQVVFIVFPHLHLAVQPCTAEEYRPPFLKEREKGLPIRDNSFKGPIVESTILPQK